MAAVGFARRVWLIGTALTGVSVVMTGAGIVLAARLALPDHASALRVFTWGGLAAVAFVLAAAGIVWELVASRVAARVEPLTRTLRAAAGQVAVAGREVEEAGRLLEQHASRHRGVYEPLAGLSVACARDTLAASRTLTTQACLLEFVGNELEDLLDSSLVAARVVAFERRAMTDAEPDAEDLPAA
jgi:hypothetical protein